MEDLIYFEGKRNVSFDGEYFTVSKNEGSKKFDPKRYLNLFAEWYFIECDKRKTVNEKLEQLDWAKVKINDISEQYGLNLFSSGILTAIDLRIKSFERSQLNKNNTLKKTRFRKEFTEIDNIIKTEYTKYKDFTNQTLSAFRTYLKKNQKHEYFQNGDKTIDSRIKKVLGNTFLK